MIGKTLAHYEVTALLGKGGMGEVYRARDTKLGRDVALKVLPRELSGDPERVARFAREARTLASLQHPNIASIYGFEEADGIRFLTMELVEGEDLSEHLSRGPIPADEALRIAVRIAAGMEAAHEKGIVHRDLKPANIKIGEDGEVKVLDFGLARAYVGDESAGGNPEHSPTITAAVTHAGVILGTAAYMSPEQARGRQADNRADIWSFGVVLFEMLSGGRLFSGETVSDTLAAVLKTEVDWSQLPGELPPRARTLLVRCLDRDRNRRLRDIGEARIMLDDELSGAPDPHLESALHSGVIPAETSSSAGGGRRPHAIMIAGAIVIGALLTFGGMRVLMPSGQVDAPLRKLSVNAHADRDQLTRPLVAPDGHAIAYLTPTHIVVREMRAREVRRFPVDGAILDLFWSPDGRSLGYIVAKRMYRLDPVSGQQQVICEPPENFTAGSGGSWGDDGTILFSQGSPEGFFEVSERGGDPRAVLPTDRASEGDLHDPFVLPGGRGVLFVPHKSTSLFSSIEIWAHGERRTLVELPGQKLERPVYSPTGHILFRRSPANTGIWAVPFSLDRLEVTGEPFLAAPSGNWPSVSSDGTLVYQSGSDAESVRLTWNDERGTEVADAGDLAFLRGYNFPALTPDGRLACASVDDGENPDLWTFDVERGTRTRLTFGEGVEEWPIWMPSGNHVLYHIRPTGSVDINTIRILQIDASGTGQPDTLAVGFIAAASADGQFVTFSSSFDEDGWLEADLAFRPMTGDRSQITKLVGAPGLQMDGRIGPGGGFVAYTSNESGEFEIYLTRFPSGEGRWQVSTDGGAWPRWNDRGDRIFYTRGNDLMVVDVTLEPSPSLGTPTLVVQRPQLAVPTVGGWPAGFDVSGDGERLLFFRNSDIDVSVREIVVVQNWYAEFETRD